MTRRSRPHLGLSGAQPSSLNTIQENDSVETFSTAGVTSDSSRKSEGALALPPDWNVQRVRRESTTDSLLSIPGLYSFDLDMTREVSPFIRSKSCPSSPLSRAHGRPGQAMAGNGMVHTPRSASSTSLKSLASLTSSSPSSHALGAGQQLGGLSEDQFSQLGRHLSRLQRHRHDGVSSSSSNSSDSISSDILRPTRRASTGMALGSAAAGVHQESMSTMKRALKVFRLKSSARA